MTDERKIKKKERKRRHRKTILFQTIVLNILKLLFNQFLNFPTALEARRVELKEVDEERKKKEGGAAGLSLQ